MQLINWEAYDRYVRCPLMHYYEQVSTNPPTATFKDTYHLVRAKAQAQVTRQWFIQGQWDNDSPAALRLWAERESRKAVKDTWIEDATGRPQTPSHDIVAEISFNLTRSLPALKNHIYEVIEPGKRPDYVLVDVEGSIPWSGDEDRTLQSQVDLVVGKNGVEVLYASRGTRSIKNLKPEQMRWIVGTHWPENGDWNTMPFYRHFYLIHHDASLRPVECLENPEGVFNGDYLKWLVERNIYVGRMRDLDYSPTPSSKSCRLCSFNTSCESRHIPRRRGSQAGDATGKTALDVPEQGKRGTHIL